MIRVLIEAYIGIAKNVHLYSYAYKYSDSHIHMDKDVYGVTLIVHNAMPIIIKYLSLKNGDHIIISKSFLFS